MPGDRQSDRELIFSRVLEAYTGPLRRLCAAYMQDPSDRQDLFQEIALALWTAWPRFRADASERTWTIMLVASAVVIWVNERGTSRFHDIDSNVLEYHRRLLQLYDRRIRILKSVKFWYAIPLLFGVSLVMRPLFVRILPTPWGIVLFSGLLLIVWLGVWQMNDVRRVGELRRRREEVQRLIEQMDRG